MPDYGNQQNSNAYAVRTNGIPIFAGDSTMLRIGFNGDSMFFTIIPKVLDPSGGKPRWPRDMGHTASFKPAVALSLYKKFNERILPDIEANRDHNGYLVLPLNREATTLAGFTYVGGKAIFSIFMNVAADRTCNEQYSFMFEPTTIIDEYAPLNGTYQVSEAQGQLFLVLEALRTFGMSATSAISHSVKNTMAWTTDNMMSHLRAVALRVGATPQQYGQYRGTDGSNFNGDGSPRFGDGPTGRMSAGVQDNSATQWQTGYADVASDGHTMVTPVNQVSSLEALMGTAPASPAPGDGDLPF